MPPRKANDDSAPVEPPRRSGRIASQSAQAEPAAAAKPQRKASTSSKKRAAEEPAQAKGESSKKKAKSAAEEPAAAAVEAGEGAPSSTSGTGDIAAIDIGDSLPSLVLKNEKGEDVQIAELANEKGVILFLVPKADTPGCTNQACGFRDSYPDFSSHNFDVYCLSADTPAAQTKWQTKKELPYALISDPKRALITALGAGEGGKTKRSHFIFEKGGKLVEKKNPVKPVESPQLALEFVKSLQS